MSKGSGQNISPAAVHATLQTAQRTSKAKLLRMQMHDREYNDRSLSYVPAAQTEIGAFRRDRPGIKAKDSYLASMIGEWMVLTLLIIATAGALFTIQTPLGHTSYVHFIRAQTETFAKAVSATWTRDKEWLQQRQWPSA